MKDTVKAIALALVAALALMFFIKPTVVKENSMEPCFEENDYLIVSRQSYGLFGGEPERGDVVVTHSGLKTLPVTCLCPTADGLTLCSHLLGYLFIGVASQEVDLSGQHLFLFAFQFCHIFKNLIQISHINRVDANRVFTMKSDSYSVKNGF